MKNKRIIIFFLLIIGLIVYYNATKTKNLGKLIDIPSSDCRLLSIDSDYRKFPDKLQLDGLEQAERELMDAIFSIGYNRLYFLENITFSGERVYRFRFCDKDKVFNNAFNEVSFQFGTKGYVSIIYDKENGYTKNYKYRISTDDALLLEQKLEAFVVK